MTILKDFTKCPLCGCEQTVCREACKDEPSIKEGTFVSLDKIACPIEEPTSRLGLPVKIILTHYDVCFSCGLKYATRIEKTSMMVNLSPQTIPGRMNLGKFNLRG